MEPATEARRAETAEDRLVIKDNVVKTTENSSDEPKNEQEGGSTECKFKTYNDDIHNFNIQNLS